MRVNSQILVPFCSKYCGACSQDYQQISTLGNLFIFYDIYPQVNVIFEIHYFANLVYIIFEKALISSKHSSKCLEEHYKTLEGLIITILELNTPQNSKITANCDFFPCIFVL